MKMKGLEPELAKAATRNPNLSKYLQGLQKKKLPIPVFMPSLSKDRIPDAEVNIIYPVGDPIFIHISGTKGQEIKYTAVEPSLTHREKEIYEELKERIFIKAGYEEIEDSREGLEKVLDRLIKESVSITDGKKEGGIFKAPLKKKIEMTEEQFFNIEYMMKRNILGSGELEPLLRDPYVEDIHAIGVGNISLIHKLFDTVETNVHFESEEELDFFLKNMSERIGRPVSMSRPIVDAALPDGSRVNIIYGDDVSIKGPSFTIRKFSSTPISIVQLVKWNTLSAEMAAYLWLALENGMSIFVCGETASGKTTTLNGMLPFILHTAKVFTAEDTPEVLPPQKIWQRLITRETGPVESRVECSTC